MVLYVRVPYVRGRAAAGGVIMCTCRCALAVRPWSCPVGSRTCRCRSRRTTARLAPCRRRWSRRGCKLASAAHARADARVWAGPCGAGASLAIAAFRKECITSKGEYDTDGRAHWFIDIKPHLFFAHEPNVVSQRIETWARTRLFRARRKVIFDSIMADHLETSMPLPTATLTGPGGASCRRTGYVLQSCSPVERRPRGLG